MLQSIIDRRLSGKNKSIGNRERFLKRYSTQIKKAVDRAINRKGLKEFESEENVSVPKKDLDEPQFVLGQGGVRDYVHPGNREYVAGDTIKRNPKGGGSGSGSGDASNEGEGEDDFVFTLTKEEFLQYFFEGLELPDLVKKVLGETPEYKNKRAGYVSSGAPNNLHIVRSMRTSLARRIALRPSEETLNQLRQSLVEQGLDGEELEKIYLEEKAKIKKIPFLDPIDLKYRDSVKVPVPTTKAAMVCVMDVSGSMDEERKNLAKRFFILLHLFLTKHYEKIEVVFISHTTKAREVSEQEFFYSQESGGTVVSSALELVDKVITERYSKEDWNVYVAQASDGDNWDNDTPDCSDLITKKILDKVQYFAYVQVAKSEQSLWEAYEEIAASHKHFVIKKVGSAGEIYPVFKELFEKKGTN